MLPRRIPRETVSWQRKTRPGDSRQHTRWIKTLPCVVCGAPADDPHHLLGNMDGSPKGMGMKNEDRWTVPVCRKDHNAAHSTGNDEAWFAGLGIDARSLASALWRVTGDDEAGQRVVFRARQGRNA